MAIFKAKHGENEAGEDVYGAPFALTPSDEGFTQDDVDAKVKTGEWVEVEPAEKPLEKRSVADLKAYADENGIDLGEATKKADVLAAILAADPQN